jgi:hypothetical protein
MNLATTQTGDTVQLFNGWRRSQGTVVMVREGGHRGIITVAPRQIRGKDYLDYVLWEGPFPTFSQMVAGKEHTGEKLQEAWDKAHPAQAPRECVRCEKPFRPAWSGPGSAVYCEKCNPPVPVSSPQCHYCGGEALGSGFFGEPVCNECGA